MWLMNKLLAWLNKKYGKPVPQYLSGKGRKL